MLRTVALQCKLVVEFKQFDEHVITTNMQLVNVARTEALQCQLVVEFKQFDEHVITTNMQLVNAANSLVQP